MCSKPSSCSLPLFHTRLEEAIELDPQFTFRFTGQIPVALPFRAERIMACIVSYW